MVSAGTDRTVVLKIGKSGYLPCYHQEREIETQFSGYVFSNSILFYSILQGTLSDMEDI